MANDCGLTFSNMVRRALELYLHLARLRSLCKLAHGELRELLLSSLPTEISEPTVSVISRVEPPAERIERTSAHHHIAFLNQEEHDFQGFRVTICRHKYTLRRYFSANDYGNAASALAAAIAVRDYTLEQLEEVKNNPGAIAALFARAKIMPIPTQRAEV